MSFFKRKSFITVLITLICVISFSVCSFVLIDAKDAKMKSKNTFEVSAAYDLKNAEHKGDGIYDISNDNYKNNSSFQISDLAGLKAFAGMVNGNKRDFDDKDVYLTSDIDCEGSHITIGFRWLTSNRYFCGNFYGQNHTISNFYSSNEYEETFSGTQWWCYGFFTKLESGSKIHDLRLKNYTIYMGNHSGQYEICGGLVGFAQGSNISIKNCVMEGLKISNPRSDGYYISGIVGAWNYTYPSSVIENCYVESTFSNFNGGYIAITHDRSMGMPTINDLVLNTPSRWENPEIVSYPNTVGDLDCSSNGGTSGTNWYYSAGYNDGYPYPRECIDWQTIKFVAGHGGGVVEPYSITVPTDIDFEFKTYGATPQLNILHYTMEPTSITDGFKIKGWTWNASNKQYTLTFEKIIYTVSFASVSYATPIGVGSYQVPHGNKISINYTPMKSGAYSKIVFTFEDTVGTQTVSYTVNNNKYYISGNTLTTSTSYTVKSNLTSIKVNTAIKSYGITIS